MSDGVSIRKIDTLDTRFEPRRWLWAEDNADSIAAYWHETRASKPRMFNGKVLVAGSYEEAAGRATARYFETDFASFLYWLRHDCPDRDVANGFALAALRCADGAHICGIMGEHTANAGKIYFPGGTPDLSDIRADGRVDFLGSVLRELEEETGLSATDVTLDDGWTVVRHGCLLAYLKLMDIPATADEVLARLEANLGRQKDPELAGFKVIRSLDDVDAGKMPLYMQAFFRHVFA